MAKKKTGLSHTLFRDINPYAEATDTATEDTLLAAPPTGGAAPPPPADARLWLPLDAVWPDPDQPRRLLPPTLQAQLVAGQLSPREAMRQWQALTPTDARLTELRRLADSIARHGLINPITVRPALTNGAAANRLRTPPGAAPPTPFPPTVQYLIVTGERRYWAHLLLALADTPPAADDTAVSPVTHIPAWLAAPGITIRAHQLIENIMREDINAVEKARGLWALRYELSQVNDSSPDVNDSSSDVNDSSPDVNDSSPDVNDSSPDVNDSSPHLVPWTEVSQVMGISPRYRMFLTAVLSLSPAAQALVRQHNLAEMTIRPIVQKLKDLPHLQLEALQQLITWQQSPADGDDAPRQAITQSVQLLVDKLLHREAQQTRPTTQINLSPQTRRFSRQVRQTTRWLQTLPPAETALLARDLALDTSFAATVTDLRQMRQQLDALLALVATYQAEG